MLSNCFAGFNKNGVLGISSDLVVEESHYLFFTENEFLNHEPPIGLVHTPEHHFPQEADFEHPPSPSIITCAFLIIYLILSDYELLEGKNVFIFILHTLGVYHGALHMGGAQ